MAGEAILGMLFIFGIIFSSGSSSNRDTDILLEEYKRQFVTDHYIYTGKKPEENYATIVIADITDRDIMGSCRR